MQNAKESALIFWNTESIKSISCGINLSNSQDLDKR